MSVIELTKSGNRIYVRFPYDPGDVSAIKAIGGGRWNASDKVWTFGLSLKTCKALREAFGDRLLIAPPLAEWAWSERRRLEELEAIRDGAGDVEPTFSRLPEVAPLLFSRLRKRPYQMQGVAFAVAGGSVLIGDQPGLGKTYEALGAIVESGARKVLISCPRTAVRTVWEAHIAELLVPDDAARVYVAQGARDNRVSVIDEFSWSLTLDPHPRPHILIVNHEMVRVRRMYRCMINEFGPTTFIIDGQPEFKDAPGTTKRSCQSDSHKHRTMYYPEYPQLFEEKWDLIMFDESHKVLASTSNKQSKNITQARLGAVRLPVSETGRKIAVSATPNRSKATKAWGTLNWLRPNVFTSYWKWAGDYFRVTEGAYSREVGDKPLDVAKFRDDMRPYLIARVKADVAPELPPIEYAGTAHPGAAPGLNNPGVWLEMLPEQAKAYRQMLELGSADLDGGTLTAIGLLAEITRRKQFASSMLYHNEDTGRWLPCLPSNKIDWILQFLEEREGFDGKVVIASQFTQLLHMIRDVLSDSGYRSLILTGETSDKDRVRFVERFQDPDDPVQIGLINSKAGGESITLDRADDMILVDEPWTDDEKRQLEDRTHRISRIHQVTVYQLRSIGTIEEKIALLTAEQRELIAQLRPEGKRLAKELLREE